MSIESYAIVNTSGLVVNVVLWDGVSPWFPPDGLTAIRAGDSGAGVGWNYADGVFSNPDATPPATAQELYNFDLAAMAAVYNSDIMSLSDQYAKAALIDGVNEDTKKAAIYAEYQARKVAYQSDLAALKVKYGV